jgi:outer membrane protein insertion porin family
MIGFVLPKSGLGQPADSTRQLIIEKVEITGNHKTRFEVIQRYVTIRPGERLNSTHLVITQQQLSQIDFFKDVDVYTKPGSEKGKVIVIIEVKERKWPAYQFEVGTSDLEGWYIIPVRFCFNNIFGRGNLLSWQWKIGHRISGSFINYRKPSLFKSGGYLDADFFAESQKFNHYITEEDTAESVWSGGIRLKWGGTRGFFKRTYASYRIAVVSPYENDVLASYFPDDFEEILLAAVGVGIYADSRDNPVYPTEGFWGAATAELSCKEIGSQKRFQKFVMDGRKYFSGFGRTVLALHGGIGYTTKGAPFYERFFLGGAYSLRGYPDRRLTPLGYGTKTALLQTEVRLPLSKSLFPKHKHTLVFFHDIGGIWLPGKTLLKDNFYQAVGVGYRIHLPLVGIVRLDLAFPMDSPDKDDFMVHIALGHTF